MDRPDESDRKRVRELRRPVAYAGSETKEPDLELKSQLVGVLATHCRVESHVVQVTESEGKDLARRLDCPFFGVSTSPDHNIMESLRALVDCWVAKQAAREARESQQRKAAQYEKEAAASKHRKRWWWW